MDDNEAIRMGKLGELAREYCGKLLREEVKRLNQEPYKGYAKRVNEKYKHKNPPGPINLLVLKY